MQNFAAAIPKERRSFDTQCSLRQQLNLEPEISTKLVHEDQERTSGTKKL